jgi:hypothetical protein
MASMQPITADVSAPILAAYRGGQMSEQEKREFEQDVAAGLVQLPAGESLQAAPAAPAAPPSGQAAPPALLDAYFSGQMTPQEQREFAQDVQAGVWTVPANVAISQREGSDVPTAPGEPMREPYFQLQRETSQDVIGPTLPDVLSGVRENIVAAVPGGIAGALGMTGGMLRGLAQQLLSGEFGTPQAADLVEREAMKGAQTLAAPFMPRTETGQQIMQTAAGALEQLPPVIPIVAQAAPLSVAARTARPAMETAARAAVQPIERAITQAARPSEALPSVRGAPSAGAAGTAIETQRMARAQGLPVPIPLTKGQATRSFEELQFEKETAKLPIGAPLREHAAAQNEDVLKNFDVLIDLTGTQAPTLREVGKSVDAALIAKTQRAKAEIRTRYKEAEKAGEMQAPASTAPVVNLLNESVSSEGLADILPATKKELIRLGGGYIDETGNVVSKDLTIKDMETLRQYINQNTGDDPRNMMFAARLKDAIDQATEGAGGQLYQRARAARRNYASEFENRAIVSKLLRTKPGTEDRAVAFEDVFNHSILTGSLDDVRHLRRVLQTTDETGQQAWRDLQGQTMTWIKEQATKNVQRDIRGNEIVSASGLDKAVKTLDADGKLDFIFGKKGAETLRDLNDLAKDIYTAPPGSVNTSNTASALRIALDTIVTGSLSGIPVPAATALREASKYMANRKTALRIREALGEMKSEEKPKPKPREPLH